MTHNACSRLCRGGHASHAFHSFGGTLREGLCLRSRRNMMKASLAGIAGLSLPDLLRQRANGATRSNQRAVILLWMTGGPSHIDMWDMKPDRPLNNRGPFSPIRTAIAGEMICEHLPRRAAMLDKFPGEHRWPGPLASSHVHVPGWRGHAPRPNHRRHR